MLISWFDSREVDAFALAIVTDITAGRARQGKQTAKKADRLQARVTDRVRAFARSHKLNVYKKARLGSRVKHGLIDAGVPADTAQLWTYEIIQLVGSAAAG